MANINDIISDNTGLVYQQLHRFKMIDDQDAESLAYEALYKAALTYNGTAAFSTYATCVIANALRMHIRKLNRKRQLDTVSYNALISEDAEDSGTFLDLIVQEDETEATVLFNELNGAVADAFNTIYSTLSDLHKKIILMWYESDYKVSQREVAIALNVSQALVSRAISSFKYKLRVELEDYL